MAEVKICGLTNKEDARLLNLYGADYAGLVMYYPKSKRNMEEEKARQVLTELDEGIKRVAVCVSPGLSQVERLNRLGFDYIQVHGELKKEVLEQKLLPIFLAYQVTEEELGPVVVHENIKGYVFDGKVSGSGKAFDWNRLKSFERKGRLLILAGGLEPENVGQAVSMLHPDVVDVSSGVEKEDGTGKDEEKIKAFIRAAKTR